jgi:hypothetical protein
MRNVNNFLVWWFMAVILAVRRLRQDDDEFQANLGYIDLVSKKKEKCK